MKESTINEVTMEILAAQNDINEYLNHTSVPMECYPDDIDRRLSEMREIVRNILRKAG